MGSDIFVILLKVKEHKTRWYNMIFLEMFVMMIIISEGCRVT